MDPIERQSLYMGRLAHDGSPLLVPRDLFREHAHFLGDTGSGKTSLGLTPFLQQTLIRGDASVVVIDLKADSTELLGTLAASITEACQRTGRRIPLKHLSNQTNRSTFGFNCLSQPYWRNLELYMRADILCGALGLTYGVDYGEGYYSSANAAVLYHTLKTYPDVTTFKELAQRVGYVVAKAKATELHPEIRKAGVHVQTVLGRLGSFEALNVAPGGPYPQAVVQESIDLTTLFTEPQVLYFHLSSALAPGSAPEIARLVAYFTLAAATQVGRGCQVYLVIDEFQRMVARNLEYMLQLARSMDVSVILANQTMQDLRTSTADLIPAIEANCRYRQWYAVSAAEDRQRLIDNSGETVDYDITRSVTSGPNGTSRSTSYHERVTQRLTVTVNPHTGQSGVLTRDTGNADYVGQPESHADRYYTVRELWNRLVERAWQSGDPGLVFSDEVNRHNPTPHLGSIRATNPCGEQPLMPYEACNLGSINLAAFVKPSSGLAYSDRIDWNSLRETAQLAVRFLDNVVEANRYPTQEIEDATRATRKIGLGVMGFADLLFELRIPYDSEEALELAERIGGLVRDAGWVASERLAEARGSFPSWQGSVWDTRHAGQPMRNAQVTTIAPTGTISIIAGCSSGVEPVFSLAFTRQVLDGQKLVEVNPVFEAALREQLRDESEVARVVAYAAAHGSIQDFAGIPDQLKPVFRTARDISPEWHVRMQAACQRHADAAVSKTVNLPSKASVQDVENAYLLAYELKCKGITVYRDGARPLQPMALSGDQAGKQPSDSPAEPARPMKLPEVMPSIRLRQPTPFGNMHLHISVDPETGLEREVFAQLGKGGDLANSDLEAICRLVSLLLRLNGDIRTVIDQLEGIGSSLSVPSKDGRIKSLGDGLAHALAKYLAAKDEHGLTALLSGHVTSLDARQQLGSWGGNGQQEVLFKIKCPECDFAGSLAFEEGCLKCHACGYSMC